MIVHKIIEMGQKIYPEKFIWYIRLHNRLISSQCQFLKTAYFIIMIWSSIIILKKFVLHFCLIVLFGYNWKKEYFCIHYTFKYFFCGNNSIYGSENHWNHSVVHSFIEVNYSLRWIQNLNFPLNIIDSFIMSGTKRYNGNLVI